jgi:kinesin family protein 4/21/27
MGTTGEDIDYSGTEFTPRTGLIPRTVQTIFERAEDIRLSSGAGATWECRLSFLELYNEEIIDLLSGSGVQITIREEREGRIVWSGIREVRVKTLAEVMQLLQEGSARRKTGETGMNATSSRSHAIFSLTMVQKKRTGITAALPTPPADRPNTPNRGLKRPSSTNGISAVRASTPTAGRTAPPSSFASKSGIPQRSSMYGVQTITPPGNDEFVIVTSKFNMVDLAGSERLKRTAAQGERMKEGISINSGLLALGNVISTRELTPPSVA